MTGEKDVQENVQAMPGTTSAAAEPFIDKAEVAKRLGLKLRTVDDWMRRGLLPYYKPGQLVRFRWSEIQAHLGESCRVVRRSRELRVEG